MPDASPNRKPADRRRAAGLVLLLALAVPVLALLSLLIGKYGMGLTGLVKALSEPTSLERIILFEIRAPRALLAPLVGAAFGLSGAALQGLLRNPLAEPSVLGAPQMAALGAAGAIFLAGVPTTSLLLPLISVLFALASVVAIALIAGARASTATMLIAGLALSSLATAALSFLLAIAENPFALAEIVYWLMGSIEDRAWVHVLIGAPFMLAGVALLLATRRGLGALALGEEVAASLGIGLERLRWLIAAGSALAIGGAVAVVGAIGFVGLLAPHLVRAIVGHDSGRALVPSALAGALLVQSADILARLIPSTSEIKVGMITALIGVPVFLVLLMRHRARFGEGL
jgi:iron complex transport system permease protein